MDTNIVGRVRALDFTGFETPAIRVIHARSLTAVTHGNAIGMRLADLVHRRLAQAVYPVVTAIFAMTGGGPAAAALPITANSDREALEFFNRYLRGARDLKDTRVIRIRDTLTLDRILVSTAVVRELTSDPHETAPYAAEFDNAGDFVE